MTVRAKRVDVRARTRVVRRESPKPTRRPLTLEERMARLEAGMGRLLRKIDPPPPPPPKSKEDFEREMAQHMAAMQMNAHQREQQPGWCNAPSPLGFGLGLL